MEKNTRGAANIARQKTAGPATSRTIVTSQSHGNFRINATDVKVSPNVRHSAIRLEDGKETDFKFLILHLFYGYRSSLIL